jgi:dTDP-4-dehydrorhamnose reductase
VTDLVVFGADGQVGRALCEAADANVAGYNREAADITDAESVARAVAGTSTVVNAAAFTSVDGAESAREDAFAVNTDGAANIARACAEADKPLIHISTNYVFDGSSERAYREDDPTGPLGIYGRSKLAGERAVAEHCERAVILRTAWIYAATGSNFVRTMLRLANERDSLRVVDDQRSSPTWAHDIAVAILAIAADGVTKPGVFHFCGSGTTTWHGFARAIFDLAGERGLPRVGELNPIPSSEYPTPAPRPANSALDCSRIAKAYGITAPPWQESLAHCLDEMR